MKKTPLFALALVLWGGVASADGISISLSSEDSRTTMGPRRNVRDARLAIQTRDRSTVLLLTDSVIAIQLTDATLAKMEPEDDKTGFLEELLAAGVRVAIGKSVEVPIASIRSIDYRDGALHIVSDQNKPVFTNVKVNGTDVLRDFSRADAERFMKAFRARR
ncbi:MAG TPA: hypothetical protein VEK79_13410 [Thermoanaerobaculia bacterium]|nr:hypothetical protein [Thermoanaerobaculia bacterium]